MVAARRPGPAGGRVCRLAFRPGSNTLTSPGGQQETLSTAEAQLLVGAAGPSNHILTREQQLGGRDVSALDRSIDLRVSACAAASRKTPSTPSSSRPVRRLPPTVTC